MLNGDDSDIATPSKQMYIFKVYMNTQDILGVTNLLLNELVKFELWPNNKGTRTTWMNDDHVSLYYLVSIHSAKHSANSSVVFISNFRQVFTCSGSWYLLVQSQQWKQQKDVADFEQHHHRSGIFIVLLNLKRFHTFSRCFRWWVWTSISQLERCFYC